MSKPVKLYNIAICPRCGKQHNMLYGKKFHKAPPSGYTHWAMCPMSGDPLFFIHPDGKLYPI
jgi:hypothetical protein